MEPEKKSNGAIVGLVIIVIILLIGGIYIWQTNQSTTPEVNTNVGELEQTETYNASVTSEDSADLDALDKELDGVDTNIDAAAINSVQ